MKRVLTALVLALYAATSFGATTNPVSLLNPTGSTAGMVVLSSGPTTPPAWGSIALSNLPLAAANTVLGNGTASSAAVTALAVPSCSAAASALIWTSATGFGCNAALITAATVASTYLTQANATSTYNSIAGHSAATFSGGPVTASASAGRPG